jgi:hypothetical protein
MDVALYKFYADLVVFGMAAESRCSSVCLGGEVVALIFTCSTDREAGESADAWCWRRGLLLARFRVTSPK